MYLFPDCKPDVPLSTLPRIWPLPLPHNSVSFWSPDTWCSLLPDCALPIISALSQTVTPVFDPAIPQISDSYLVLATGQTTHASVHDNLFRPFLGKEASVCGINSADQLVTPDSSEWELTVVLKQVSQLAVENQNSGSHFPLTNSICRSAYSYCKQRITPSEGICQKCTWWLPCSPRSMVIIVTSRALLTTDIFCFWPNPYLCQWPNKGSPSYQPVVWDALE